MAAYDRQDTLRGSNGRGRSWWDVQKYDLSIEFDTAKKTVSGFVFIKLKVIGQPTDSLQIDLQEGLFIDTVDLVTEGDHSDAAFSREGNVYWIKNDFSKWKINENYRIIVHYYGKPRPAIIPPWDGGFIWTKDSLKKPWIAVACQGLGASAWWPCKDYQGDKPDKGMSMQFWIPGKLKAVGNGKLQHRYAGCGLLQPSISDKDLFSEMGDDDDSDTYNWDWVLENPINTYNVTFYLGDYAHWQDTIIGEKGKLDLNFYPLKYNDVRSRDHFKVAKQMLHCFEHWMGPYPFYEDGYKLVEAPFLGMEHQSAIAYGNQYKMGYRGSDRSASGVGMLFDYIIIHESGHEWFGNNITAQDIADNWIHEGFTTYSETLFAEWITNKDSAFLFARGEWKNIRNDKPVIGDYGVNDDGSSDKYDKGAALIHMIRMMINDDEKFRQLLRGLNKDFYHQIVTSKQVEDYIIRFTGLPLAPMFDQYLRTTKIPELQYYMIGKTLRYRFVNTVPGFTLPIAIEADGRQTLLNPTDKWQKLKWKGGKDYYFSENFLYEQHYVLE